MTGQVDQEPGAITFAVVSGWPSAESYLTGMCHEIAQAIARPITPRVLPSYATLKEEVAAGRAQIVWAPPIVAIELEDKGLGTIGLCCTRGGQVDYHAAIFTQHASRIEKLSDLQGCHMAWVDANSSAGYLVPRMRLVAEGLDPEKLFGQESFLGTHARVACAVLDGKVDAGATYLSLEPGTGRPLSAGWLEGGAAINGAFIVATAGPIPSDAIVFASSVEADLRQAIVTQLMALPASAPKAMRFLLGADGFALPREAHFEALRALVAKR